MAKVRNSTTNLILVEKHGELCGRVIKHIIDKWHCPEDTVPGQILQKAVVVVWHRYSTLRKGNGNSHDNPYQIINPFQSAQG